jgi:hypothetical protein
LQGKEEEVTIHKIGKKYDLYNEAGQAVQTGFTSRKAAIEYAVDNDLKLVDQFTY